MGGAKAVNSDYVWAFLGVLCLLIMFTMMILGVRNVRAEEGTLQNTSKKDEADE